MRALEKAFNLDTVSKTGSFAQFLIELLRQDENIVLVDLGFLLIPHCIKLGQHSVTDHEENEKNSPNSTCRFRCKSVDMTSNMSCSANGSSSRPNLGRLMSFALMLSTVMCWPPNPSKPDMCQKSKEMKMSISNSTLSVTEPTNHPLRKRPLNDVPTLPSSRKCAKFYQEIVRTMKHQCVQKKNCGSGQQDARRSQDPNYFLVEDMRSTSKIDDLGQHNEFNHKNPSQIWRHRPESISKCTESIHVQDADAPVSYWTLQL